MKLLRNIMERGSLTPAAATKRGENRKPFPSRGAAMSCQHLQRRRSAARICFVVACPRACTRGFRQHRVSDPQKYHLAVAGKHRKAMSLRGLGRDMVRLITTLRRSETVQSTVPTLLMHNILPEGLLRNIAKRCPYNSPFSILNFKFSILHSSFPPEPSGPSRR